MMNNPFCFLILPVFYMMFFHKSYQFPFTSLSRPFHLGILNLAYIRRQADIFLIHLLSCLCCFQFFIQPSLTICISFDVHLVFYFHSWRIALSFSWYLSCCHQRFIRLEFRCTTPYFQWVKLLISWNSYTRNLFTHEVQEFNFQTFPFSHRSLSFSFLYTFIITKRNTV